MCHLFVVSLDRQCSFRLLLPAFFLPTHAHIYAVVALCLQQPISTATAAYEACSADKCCFYYSYTRIHAYMYAHLYLYENKSSRRCFCAVTCGNCLYFPIPNWQYDCHCRSKRKQAQRVPVSDFSAIVFWWSSLYDQTILYKIHRHIHTNLLTGNRGYVATGFLLHFSHKAVNTTRSIWLIAFVSVSVCVCERLYFCALIVIWARKALGVRACWCKLLNRQTMQLSMDRAWRSVRANCKIIWRNNEKQV